MTPLYALLPVVESTYGGIPIVDTGDGQIYFMTVSTNDHDYQHIWYRGDYQAIQQWADDNNLTVQTQACAQIDSQRGIPLCAGG